MSIPDDVALDYVLSHGLDPRESLDIFQQMKARADEAARDRELVRREAEARWNAYRLYQQMEEVGR